MTYKEQIERIYKNAVNNGLWDHNDVHQHVSHINSEISEAYSAYSKGRHAKQSNFDHADSKDEKICFFKCDIHNTLEDKAADIRISLLSLAGHLKLTLDTEHAFEPLDLVIERAMKHDNVYIIINRIHQLVSNIPNQYYSQYDKIPQIESKIRLCLNAVDQLASHCNTDLNYFERNKIWFNSTRNYKHQGE